MKRFKPSLETVKKILEKYPATRDNNDSLYVAYGLEKGVISETEAFELVVTLVRIWVYESITRARRKVVELHPELWPSKRVAKLRQEKEERAVLTRWASIADDRRYPPLVC